MGCSLGLVPLPLVLPLPLPLVPPPPPSRGKTPICSSFRLPLTSITLTFPCWWNSLFQFIQVPAYVNLTLAPSTTRLTIGYLKLCNASILKATFFPPC